MSISSVPLLRSPLIARRLLWVDCGAGLLVGALVLALSEWLARWYDLPQPLVIGNGVTNIAYAAFSFSLARRARRPPSLLVLLVVANATWAALCVIAAILMADQASLLGMTHLLAEGVFVGGLAAVEWSYRGQLLVRA